MKIETHLPSDVRSISYVKNHHYIKIEDSAGNTTQLNASAILIGDCESCQEKCLAFNRIGNMRCTHCGGYVKWAWSRPQLSFIPEKESDFNVAMNFKRPGED